jgi:Uma2 family endonuclease
VKTVVLGPRPGELQALIERRKRLGIDLFDEVWEGSYHMAPAAHPAHGYVDNQLAVLLAPYAAAAQLIGTGPFNLGDADDYRVPDGGYHRSLPTTVWAPTAAIVVEVVSPDDETYEKFGFYADHGVDELIIADPDDRSVRGWRLGTGGYAEVGESELLSIGMDALTELIAWP